jgi:hypothetical protein
MKGWMGGWVDEIRRIQRAKRDMSIILCQYEHLARGLPSFQGRDRDSLTKKMTIPQSVTVASSYLPLLPSTFCPLPSAFCPLPSTH